VSDSTNIPENGQQERRAVPRAKTLRQAVFSAFMDGGGLIRGTAVDISPNGIQIRTRHPERLGRQIEVELYPKSGDRSGRMITVRGRVVRVDPVGNTEYAMGVRFLMSFPVSDPLRQPQLGSSEEALAALRLASEQLRKLDDGTPSPLAYVEHLRNENLNEVAFRPWLDPVVRRRRRIARIVSVLISSSILFVILWRGASCQNNQLNIDRIPGGGVHQDVRDAQTSPAAGRNPRFIPRAEAAAWAREKPPPQLLSRAQGWLAAGQAEAAEEVFKTLLEQGTAAPAEAFAARVGRAHALAALDRRSESLSLLADALGSGTGVPAPWIAMGREMRQAIARGDVAARIPPLVDAFEVVDDETLSLVPQQDGEDSRQSAPIIGGTPMPLGRDSRGDSGPSTPESAAEPGGVGERGPAESASPAPRIEVSTSQYVLTVFRGEECLGVFPVGLGRDGTTPHGEFRIANKIENPDWFDRGRVVKAGDPDNPLGASWMGLGNEKGATSYGIHPTNEPESIGGNLSRGCIRMRPDDAATLFAACPIGTPVQIGP